MDTTVTTTTEAITSGVLAAPPLRMSYEEYLVWEHEGGLTEWIDGEVIIHMSPTIGHQTIVIFLSSLLQNFVLLYRLGRVLAAPVAMRAVPGGNAREPDVLFLTTDHLAWLTEKEVDGPADLVIEVISPDSVARDRVDKFYEYQEAGVREYWMIDSRPRYQRADFYVLDEQGLYQPVPIPADGIYRSTVLPSFWLKVDWLWQDEPNPLAALAEIVGIEQLMTSLQGKPLQ